MKINPWKLATFFLLGVMALLLWMGVAPYQQKLSPYQQNAEPKTPSNTVEAQQFVLKDSSGKVRAQLSMRDGQPRLVFYDENGHERYDVPPPRGLMPLQEK